MAEYNPIEMRGNEDSNRRSESGKRAAGGNRGPYQAKPLVSVIMASYNHGKTIEQAIRSIVAQEYERKEIIVIDGGSTDGTEDILRKYSASIDYWVSEPDEGVYYALNKGIDLARGEWLYFLGADDILADRAVFRDFFSVPRVSKILYGNVIWRSSGSIYGGKFTKRELCRRNICQQAIFYRRELFQDLGKFDTRYPLHADWVFNMNAFAKRDTNPVFLDRTVAVYSTEGMSGKRIDPVFRGERGKLVRDLFGFQYSVCVKICPPFEYWFRLDRQHILWVTAILRALITGNASVAGCRFCCRKTLFVKASGHAGGGQCIYCKNSPAEEPDNVRDTGRLP